MLNQWFFAKGMGRAKWASRQQRPHGFRHYGKLQAVIVFECYLQRKNNVFHRNRIWSQTNTCSLNFLIKRVVSEQAGWDYFSTFFLQIICYITQNSVFRHLNLGRKILNLYDHLYLIFNYFNVKKTQTIGNFFENFRRCSVKYVGCFCYEKTNKISYIERGGGFLQPTKNTNKNIPYHMLMIFINDKAIYSNFYVIDITVIHIILTLSGTELL